jgi:flagellar biosynthesis protein FlhG
MTDAMDGTHYDVLGLDPRASGERIEKAYRFHVALYEDAALATYSLLDPDEVRAARIQIREAYEVLSDPVRRHEYDVSLGVARADAPLLRFDASSAAPATGGPAGATVASAAAAAADAPRPTPAALVRERLSGPVTGAVLRQFRERRGVGLHEIATVSKVGVRFLEYIEQDRHSDLPAPVYLRGFLQEYARCLGLEPQSTADAYLARVPKQI